MEIKDILGIGKLATELLNKLEKFGGFCFAPRQIKRIGNAQIEVIKKAKVELGGNIDISINNGNIEIHVGQDGLYLSNMISNLIKNEIRKQENINQIVEKTIEILNEKPDVNTSIEFDQNWLNNFLEYARNVSDEEMQRVWARILAEESINSNSYSILTLNTLKNMTKKDAQTFVELIKNVFLWGDQYVLLNFNECKELYNISAIDILNLSELGLINDPCKYIKYNKGKIVYYVKNGYVYKHENLSGNTSFECHVLTRVGRELRKLVFEERDFSEEQLKAIFDCESGFQVSIHKQAGEDMYCIDPIKTIR